MPNNGLTLTDGVDTLDCYLAAFAESEPRKVGGSAASFNGTLRSSVRYSLREFTATVPHLGKTDYQTLRGMIENDAVVTVSGDALLNETISAIVTATFALVGVNTPVDGVNFVYDAQLTIREVTAVVDDIEVTIS